MSFRKGLLSGSPSYEDMASTRDMFLDASKYGANLAYRFASEHADCAGIQAALIARLISVVYPFLWCHSDVFIVWYYAVLYSSDNRDGMKR